MAKRLIKVMEELARDKRMLEDTIHTYVDELARDTYQKIGVYGFETQDIKDKFVGTGVLPGMIGIKLRQLGWYLKQTIVPGTRSHIYLYTKKGYPNSTDKERSDDNWIRRPRKARVNR